MANSAPSTETPENAWPTWAKGLASLAIGWQVASLLAAELAQAPASPLEHAIADRFGPYYRLVDQGTAHRFYSDIGPTPILLVEVRFGDGRPPKVVRIPDRSVRPRVNYQRELALANKVWSEAAPALDDLHLPIESPSARSLARRLCLREPGCSGVTIRLQQHFNPSPDLLIEAAGARGARPVDPDSEEFYSVPRLLGDYPCPMP